MLVTYRRPDVLAHTLDAIERQTVSLDHVFVVDNDPNRSALGVVEARSSSYSYIATGANLGPAGGLRAGVDAIGDDYTWVMFLDDDDPPPGSRLFENARQFLEAAVQHDPNCGGVGTAGALFDRRLGRSRRPDMKSEPRFLGVDWIGGGQFPIYNVQALRAVGAPDPSTFWGYDDLDLGLRLTRPGRNLYRDRDFAISPDDQPPMKPQLGSPAVWRLYYTNRNLVALMKRESSMGWAILAGVRGVAAAFVRTSGRRFGGASAAGRGLVDALRGRAGWSDRAGGPAAS